ncbi:hypothetical protein LTR84_006591 [Exophiala bonariae]|uniref:F-type H+-transporting ATPase subunit G n=1 Tax=Exophiala bonariae TaxID=1690606 RepID=A0AAV9N1P9_9EURO|nr:hypothetical protein LTR84_006591 [Exophiala bonariae]
MSAAPTSRAIVRQSKLLLRRNNFRQASTTSEAAAKAQETGQQAVSKASEGLSRVQSSASSAISKAGDALGKVGGRTGRVISRVQSLIPPTIYYSRVGLELSKILYKGQQWAPPSLAQFQSYFQPLANVVRNPRSLSSGAASVSNSINLETILRSIRNVNRQQLTTVGLVGAEVLGFFTVGEMIGRFKLVGYHGDAHHGH